MAAKDVFIERVIDVGPRDIDVGPRAIDVGPRAIDIMILDRERH